MDAKTPTQRMFDELVEKVMLYLREANCFGEPINEPDDTGEDKYDEETLEFYENEVRAAIGTVINPTIDVVAVYTLDDVNFRLKYSGLLKHALTSEMKLAMLNDVVHGDEMREAFELAMDTMIDRANDELAEG